MDSESKTESSAARVDLPPPSPAMILSKSVAWVGASTGALTLICTVFGFLVEHAWLDQLGIPRTMYEARSSEYVVTGAKFLAGVIPMAVTGSLLFALDYWWMIPLLALFAAAVWKFRLNWEARVVIAALLYAVWINAILLRFERAAGRPDQNALAIFTFGTVLGLLYCYAETFIAAQNPRAHPLRHLLSRLPLFGLVFCCVFALPYLKGAHGTQRVFPTIQFLGKDRTFFCDLAGEQSRANCGSWELIELGKERALFRRSADRSIYVVPASSLTTFQLMKGLAQK